VLAPLIPLVLGLSLGGGPLSPPVRCVRPRLELLRADDNLGSLRDPSCRADLWDAAKYVELSPTADVYLSFGADLRLLYETVRNGNWGQSFPDNSTSWWQRYMAHIDLRAGETFRAFLQLSSSLVNGPPGSAPTDDLDVHQALVELGGQHLRLRLGRQEMQLGAARLVAVNDGPNIRRTFDGARLTAAFEGWQLDVFGLLPVSARPGFFDDSSSFGNQFWGIYSAGPISSRILMFDLYYLGVDRTQATFDQGRAKELRHTAGIRGWGHAGTFDYDLELTCQWGSFGSGSIRAWAIALATRYGLGRAYLSLKADLSSGDRNPANPNLETFNPLFPRSSYFGVVGFIGNLNQMELHPALGMALTPHLAAEAEAGFFWRQSLEDGLYGASGALRVSGHPATARLIGEVASANLNWTIDVHFNAIIVCAHILPGPFLTQSASASDLNYLGAWVVYRF
jgi:hypothetical protein